jgi:hypothetical protein
MRSKQQQPENQPRQSSLVPVNESPVMPPVTRPRVVAPGTVITPVAPQTPDPSR